MRGGFDDKIPKQPGKNCRLVCLTPPGTGGEFVLAGVRALVGRASNHDVDLDVDAFAPRQPSPISRLHAEIRWADGQPEVVDLDSANGTFVNREKLTPLKPSPLRDGDRVAFADVEFEVKFDA